MAERQLATALEVTSLTKRYGARDALKNVSLTIESSEGGVVHALIGKNGSGKTTLIRCMLGLARPTAGRVRLLGADVGSNLHQVIGRVGAIVEQPKFFASYSGRLNLELLAQIEELPLSEVDRVLDSTGMTDRCDDPISEYSLGMKQRIAIAAALLKQPSLLVLDEPTNGLDPFGVVDIWKMISLVAESGCSVLVASHNLTDLERGCTDATILDQGSVIATGSVESIRSSVRPARLHLVTRDSERTEAVLRRSAFSFGSHPVGGLLLDVDDEKGAEEVCRLLAAHDIYPSQLVTEQTSLEEAFLKLLPKPPPPSVEGGQAHTA